ncbi:dTDP-glucose 4,6-dehydratase [Polaribacter vadi]|uniref:dTDP-glucose 4,6-dehydratase n=1 Tax=Polaribacter vadi TaxID=1774273 RepID=A0A1B8U2V2_9FLAO|nr:dTDP-glucose 4,6-dehydratase [Polaribacter vadi]AOW17497.1 dTDP-glucose 4,6-dehydratase [Polaribacter vadi]OBY66188.1 dTDP-glucose 4,6-dehydratase [Polaribacter vadi]
MQKILITGGAGFIGANFIPYFLKNNSDHYIVNLDLLTYAGDLQNLEEVENNEHYNFVKGDICNRKLVEDLFKEHQFNGVIHFAAESHVDNSIKNPDAFIKTNINGTFTVLDVAKKHWLDSSNNYKEAFKNARFHHISTDEVYGTLGEEGLFTEETLYAPNSPYSASKASSDFLVRSYFHTYGLNVITTNCSNNYGPKQHQEKLIPTIIGKAIAGEDIPIYGDGKNIRDWLYVLDHCNAIELAFKKGKAGETYNVGGNNEHTNLFIANSICAILDKVYPKKNSYKQQITFVKDRLGHDFRYAIDASKIERELGWKANENFQSGIEKTIHWYLKKLNI